MKPLKTWIAVADGAHARILLHASPEGGTKTIPKEIYADHAEFTHELGDERPGRTFNSVGNTRHAVEPHVDLHERREEEFLQKFALHINDSFAKDAFDQLIIVTPPRALGILRKNLSDQIRKHIIAEIGHDLAQRPDHEIAAAVAKAVVGFGR
jgi:protein required for attachment to host cells